MKHLFYATVLVASSLFFVSCSATQGANLDAKTAQYTHFQHMSLAKVHKRIAKAGRDAGWRITEFKENTLIAEKISDHTKAVTISFTENSFMITPPDDQLQDAIEAALED